MTVDFDWGEYVIWHLGPQVRVSVDGRRETVYAPPEAERFATLEMPAAPVVPAPLPGIPPVLGCGATKGSIPAPGCP